jgi:hypothetical protein
MKELGRPASWPARWCASAPTRACAPSAC